MFSAFFHSLFSYTTISINLLFATITFLGHLLPDILTGLILHLI